MKFRNPYDVSGPVKEFANRYRPKSRIGSALFSVGLFFIVRRVLFIQRSAMRSFKWARWGIPAAMMVIPYITTRSSRRPTPQASH